MLTSDSVAPKIRFSSDASAETVKDISFNNLVAVMTFFFPLEVAMNTIKVLLVDDHSEFRKVVHDFLDRLPNISVVGEAENGKEAIDQVERLVPDLVVMDISMPIQSGLEATHIIKQRWPMTKVLIATMHDNPLYRLQAQEAKADGFLLKSQLKNSLEAAFGGPVDPPGTKKPK